MRCQMLIAFDHSARSTLGVASDNYLEQVALRRRRFRLEDIIGRNVCGIFQLFHQKCLPAVDIFGVAKWRLQHAAILLTVANRTDFDRIDQTPKVILVVATVETYPQSWSQHTDHRSNAR